MDIAYFISDLLGQQGEVTVPNLGYFLQIRMPAYYDNRSRKFMPPHYTVEFNTQVIDDEDDALANHITSIKKISPSSAKYFVEKFVSNLKSQAVIEDVPFSNLGVFSSDGLKLSFAPAPNTDDPAFYGLSPLEVYRVGETLTKKPAPVFDTPPPPDTRPEMPKPVIQPAVINTPALRPERVAAKSAVADEEEEDLYLQPRSGIATWMIIVGVVALLVIGLGTLYKFKPGLFQALRRNKQATAITHSATPISKNEDVSDTVVIVPNGVGADSVGADSSKSQVAANPVSKAAAPATKTIQPATLSTPPAAAINADKKDKKDQAKVPADNTNAAPAVNTPAPVKTTAKTPVIVSPAAPTTTPSTNTGSVETVTRGMWVIYAGAYPVRPGADRRIQRLKELGFVDARLATDKVGRGGNYKVILGAFNTRSDAEAHSKELLATGKLTKGDLFVDKY